MTLPEPTTTLVGYCFDCEAYTNPPEETCPGQGEVDGPDDEHVYEERQVYICRLPDHCDQTCFFDVGDLLRHERGD